MAVIVLKIVMNVQPETDDEEIVMTSKIRVLVRVRPTLEFEKDESTDRLKCFTDKGSVALEKQKQRVFQFDGVVGKEDTQDAVFEKGNVGELIQSVIDGYDATIFAYGQTGSGKTYTMEGYKYEGNNDDPRAMIKGTKNNSLGLVPKSISYLFDELEKRNDASQFRVECSFVQIYNEKIFDLLNPGHLDTGTKVSNLNRNQKIRMTEELSGLKLRFDTSMNQFYVENVFEVVCRTKEDLLHFFEKGVRSKVMGSHRLNAASSRSHCMLNINVHKSESNQNVSSRLCLIDLAGSERVSVTGASGKTLKEASSINQSLFALRKVIVAVSAAQQNQSDAFVPYRDSKLTSLLQSSIGGNSHTLMIACISPCDKHLDENMSTLSYAAKANCIQTQVTRKEDEKSKLIRKLRNEIKLLRKQLVSAQEISAINIEEKQSKLLDSSDDTHLKQQLLSSITIAKMMHATERELRRRMELAEASIVELSEANAALLNENQSVRDREQVLLHLLNPIDGDNENSVTKELLRLRQENARLKDELLQTGTAPENNLKLPIPAKPTRQSAKQKRPLREQAKVMSAIQLKQLLSGDTPKLRTFRPASDIRALPNITTINPASQKMADITELLRAQSELREKN